MISNTMAFRMIIVSLVIVTISSICYVVEGDKFAKEAVTTIKTEYGDIYDCVDIYKQPSLNHPLLKDHKIQMSPSKGFKDKLASLLPKKRHNKIIDANIGLKKGCPPGTVPIRRYSSKHLKRARLASQQQQLDISSKWDRGLEFAGIQTIATTSSLNEFQSAGAVMSLYNPEVGDHQFSSAMISIEGGNPLNQIQFGWTVNPDLYGDNKTRLFTSWTADNHQKTGCFNVQCPGFVLVDSNFPLDFAFPNMSIDNDVSYEMGLFVSQDNDKNWWLHTFDRVIITIGYWPRTLFTSMATYADTIKWGGQVFTPPTDDSSPQMGSGMFKNGRYDRTCYMRHVLYENSTGIVMYPDEGSITSQTVESRCYFAGDASYKDDRIGYSLLFGGGGGKDHSYTCEY